MNFSQSDKVKIVLVDEDDREIGTMPKLAAHIEGKLHRAISVFAFDREENWILQRRAVDKYHSGGLWSNTCCSHPLPGEHSTEAASRRLKEEMGMEGTPSKIFNFRYKAPLENNLTENELDHIFLLYTDELPCPNIHEVADWKKLTYLELRSEISKDPESFTVWFRLMYERVYDHLRSRKY